jgi:hypothetical protein
MLVAGEMNFATASDWTPVAADTQYSEDGAAFANTNSTPSHEGNGIWSLALLSTELDGAITVISIVDSATKAVEDQAIIIATYGDATAQHAFDLDTATQSVNVTQINGATGPVGNLEDDYDGTGYNKSASAIGTATALGSGAVSAAAVATDAIDADALATGGVQEIRDAITGGAYALDTDASGRVRVVDGTGAGEIDTASGRVQVTEAQIDQIVDEVWDETSTGHVDAGKAGQQLWTDVDAILDDTGTSGVALTDGSITAAKIATDAITSAEIAASGANKIADHTIRRTFQNACDSSDGDTKTYRSLLGAIGKLVNRIVSSGGTLTIYEDDDTTSLGTQSVTTDSGADPITELDTT